MTTMTEQEQWMHLCRRISHRNAGYRVVAELLKDTKTTWRKVAVQIAMAGGIAEKQYLLRINHPDAQLDQFDQMEIPLTGPDRYTFFITDDVSSTGMIPELTKGDSKEQKEQRITQLLQQTEDLVLSHWAKIEQLVESDFIRTNNFQSHRPPYSHQVLNNILKARAAERLAVKAAAPSPPRKSPASR